MCGYKKAHLDKEASKFITSGPLLKVKRYILNFCNSHGNEIFCTSLRLNARVLPCLHPGQRYTLWSAPNNSNETYTFMCLSRDPEVLGSAKTALEFEYEIQIG